MVYPSRLGLAEYQAYGQEVQSLAAYINAKWSVGGVGGSGVESGGTGGTGGTDGSDGRWIPILLEPEDNYPRSVAALRRSDVLLVNPVRDGLNLVAKEGPLVNERDGVLVLSRNAGAWDELGGHAIGVNPFDVSGTAGALDGALRMPIEERAERSAGLRSAASAVSPLDWFDSQLSRAAFPDGS
jgi:trehalose 6-phosphate synthase